MRSLECRWSKSKGTWPDTKGSGFESQSAVNFSCSKYLLLEKMNYLFNSYKANENVFGRNGGIPPNVHAHEHLLNKRTMHMCMHIP